MEEQYQEAAPAAPAIEKGTSEKESRTRKVLELLLKANRTITSEVEQEKLVQRITDIGTELTGAQFGAFFYNVTKPDGESYLLYTISGVPREAFSKFPMPRNTKIFEPTFAGKGVTRYDDVTKAEHYGKNAPYKGMPHGHLPVRSYLSVPVISSINGEVIGGLFFGHSDAAVFDETSEIIVKAIAAQAAVAMGNAQLFEAKKRTEQVLFDQKEQYRSIFNSTFDAMIICNDRGQIIEANPAGTQLLGFRHSDLTSINVQQLFPTDPNLLDAIKAYVDSGRKFVSTTIIKTSEGNTLHVYITATQFYHKDDLNILLVLKDVTSDRVTEEALRKSEEFAQVITKASPVTLWMTDTNGKTIYINDTWLDWVGGTFEQHLGFGWLNSIIDEDRNHAERVFNDSFQRRVVFTTDFRIARRDGDIRWCAIHGSPYYNAEGQFAGYAGSLTDITERKIAEEKLESRNILINTIADNTTQALFMMDDRQFCTYMNPAAEKMTGYKIEEVQEKPLHYYVHHTHPDGTHFPIEDCPIDRALPTEMQTQGEEIFVHKDGSFYPVAFTASPILENGVPKGTVIEARNVAEERRIQAELRDKETLAKRVLEQTVRERTADLEKTNYELLQFTSVASHDLKEPLRKISVFSGRIQDIATNISDPAFHRYLETIQNSSQRMSKLIDDLLSFSRLSQTNVDFKSVDLNILLEQITHDLEIAISEKNARVIYENLPVVNGMPLQLGQLFQNLISNSLKFSDPGRDPEIRITCELIQKNGHAFHSLLYQDNGIGFDNTFATKIFEIFQRLHSKDQFEGTGIGLAIVKKIVTLHNGDITAHGQPGIGSTFKIELPAQV